jgi:hypothetical protein
LPHIAISRQINISPFFIVVHSHHFSISKHKGNTNQWKNKTFNRIFSTFLYPPFHCSSPSLLSAALLRAVRRTLPCSPPSTAGQTAEHLPAQPKLTDTPILKYYSSILRNYPPLVQKYFALLRKY